MDRDDDGRLVDLMTIHNRVEAEIIRGVLAQEGIRTWAQTAPGPYMEFLGTNAFLPTLIRVRPGDEGLAREVLERNRQDSVDIDWSEVDVGEAMDPLAAEIGRRDDAAVAAGRRERSALSKTLRWMMRGIGVLAIGLVSFGPLVLIGIGAAVRRLFVPKRTGDSSGGKTE